MVSKLQHVLTTQPGKIALVGSGEYLPSMIEVEKSLLKGRPPKFVQIPTAASNESEERFQYWINLGLKQAELIGVEGVPLKIKTREDANNKKIVSQLEGAGLIYLSGGNPKHLVDVIKGTLLESEIIRTWKEGASLAGCSAGAMAISAWVAGFKTMIPHSFSGLEILPQISVIPHFDRFLGKLPPFIATKNITPPKGVTLVGIDEETALVGGPENFIVAGNRRVWVILKGKVREYHVGDNVFLPRVT